MPLHEIRIEFFGIPRARAGVSEAALQFSEREIEFSQALALLAERFPQLAAECIVNGALCAGFAANVDGQRFVRNPTERIVAGETLLILSADAGG